MVGLRVRSADEVSATMVKLLEPAAAPSVALFALLSDLSLELRRAEADPLAVLLFGSAARGDLAPFSDIDVRVITRGKPRTRERLLLRERPGGFFQISVSARSLEETLRMADDPEEWLWMREAFGEAVPLWEEGDPLAAVRRRIIDAAPAAGAFAQGASRDLEILLDAASKAKNAATSGDAGGLLISAHALAQQAVRLLLVLNPPPRRLPPARMLDAAAGFHVAPEHLLEDVAICLGAAEGMCETSQVLARCLRLGGGVLAVLAQHAAKLPLRADLLEPLLGGRLAAVLLQEDGWDPDRGV
ncbi:MAG: nucleotidyltransferase domain-containing protein [Thermaerobacter sp.]|nr:nucleotidyltransferase domain-containing protein [Thermaerobacter sp.]